MSKGSNLQILTQASSLNKITWSKVYLSEQSLWDQGRKLYSAEAQSFLGFRIYQQH